MKTRWGLRKGCWAFPPAPSFPCKTQLTLLFFSELFKQLYGQAGEPTCLQSLQIAVRTSDLYPPHHFRNYIILLSKSNSKTQQQRKLLNIEASNRNKSQTFYHLVIMSNNIKRCSSETWTIGYYASTKSGWSINVNDLKVVKIVQIDYL